MRMNQCDSADFCLFVNVGERTGLYSSEYQRTRSEESKESRRD